MPAAAGSTRTAGAITPEEAGPGGGVLAPQCPWFAMRPRCRRRREAVAGLRGREEDGTRTWLNGGARLSGTTGVAPDRAASRRPRRRRSRRSTRPHGVLFRRLCRRRLEDDRRWNVLGERLRRLLEDRGGRRHRRRRCRSQRRLCRYGGDV